MYTLDSRSGLDPGLRLHQHYGYALYKQVCELDIELLVRQGKENLPAYTGLDLVMMILDFNIFGLLINCL